MIKTSKIVNLRKVLLAGTAIVAVGAFSTGASAADLKLLGDSTWGTDAPVDNTVSAGDNVELDGYNLTVNEGNVTEIGAITDVNATPDGTVTFDANAGDNAATVVTVGSIDIGSGAITVQSTEATAGSPDTVTVTVTGGITTTGDLSVTGGSSNAGDHATLNVGGNISAGSIAINFDGGGAEGTLVLNGSAAQTVAGAVSGDGDITVSNTHSSGVTFTGANTGTGTITVSAADDTNQAVTFTGDVSSAVKLGNNAGGETITATYGGSAATAVSGAIAGDVAETTNLAFVGGDTVTLTGAVSAIDTASVSGSTTVTTDQDFAATNITVASGSTLATTNNTITGAIANAGTLTLGGGNVTGGITGAGALDVDAAATVTGVVTQGATDIAAAGDLTLAAGTDNYTVTTTTFSGAGTLSVGAGDRTITTNVTNTTDGEGTVTVLNGAGTTAFVGDLGASTDNSLAALTMGGAAGQIVTTTGNLYVDAITVTNAADEIQFLGATGTTQVVSGTINDNGGHNEGVIRIGDDTLTPTVQFDGTIGDTQRLNTLEVNEGSTAFLNADASLDTAVTVDTGSTLRIGAGDTLTVQATGAITNNGTIQIDVEDTDGTLTVGDFGQIASADEELDTDSVTINVIGSSIGTADNLDLFGDLTFDESKVLKDNSALYVFTVDVDHNIDVTLVSGESFSDTASKAIVANELISLASTATGDLKTVVDTLLASDSNTSGDVIEAAASDVSGGGVVAGLTVSNQTSSINALCLASIRDGSATGMSAGNGAEGLKVWGQAFGSQADQDERDGVSGYDLDTYGIAVGVDSENIADNMVVGLAFAYGDTDVESDSIANTKTEIDSYTLSLYGDYDLDGRTYISAQLGYTWSDVDTTRNPGGLAALTAKGNYDSSQINARVELGHDYRSGALTLTPSVLTNYVYYDADSYTETGAGGANLTVDTENLSLFEVGVGIDAAWTLENADGSYVKPVLSAGVRHDLIGDEFEASNTFQGGSSGFKVEGFDPAQTTFDVGAGVTYFSTGGWDLSAEYDYEFKSDYDSHSGLLKASYNF